MVRRVEEEELWWRRNQEDRGGARLGRRRGRRPLPVVLLFERAQRGRRGADGVGIMLGVTFYSPMRSASRLPEDRHDGGGHYGGRRGR